LKSNCIEQKSTHKGTYRNIFNNLKKKKRRRIFCIRTDPKPEAGCKIGDGIDITIYGSVSQIDQEAKSGHHGCVDHADRKADPSNRRYQLIDVLGIGRL
jgi:hypothetical protein